VYLLVSRNTAFFLRVIFMRLPMWQEPRLVMVAESFSGWARRGRLAGGAVSEVKSADRSEDIFRRGLVED
jgi:hypothetical protein